MRTMINPTRADREAAAKALDLDLESLHVRNWIAGAWSYKSFMRGGDAERVAQALANKSAEHEYARGVIAGLEERNRELLTEADRLRLLLQKAEEVVLFARQLGAYDWAYRLDDSKTSDDARHDAQALGTAVYLYDRAATGKS